MKGKTALVAVALILLGVGVRLLPHPANFAPIGALAIFGGAVLPRRFGVWVPVAAVMLSDMVIGFYDIMPVVWGCYAVIAVVSGRWLHRNLTVLRGATFSLAASLFFFVVTNFAVWITSGMYTHSISGFAQCYAAALPFFRNTVLGDLLYTGALFGAYVLAERAMNRNVWYMRKHA